jgi:holo-[acyl-carrier protein] synthase
MSVVIENIERITGRESSDIKPHSTLTSLGLSPSIGLNLLRGSLERALGYELPELTWKMTVAEVVALTERPATPLPAMPHGPAALSTVLPSFGLGMDLEEIQALPIATDFRAHDFYRAHFSPTELSTAFLKPDPRVHLCGIYCAKEAVKKSHPDLLHLRMLDIGISHDENGRPLVSLTDANLQRRFLFQISITHTSSVAAATCLVIGSTP